MRPLLFSLLFIGVASAAAATVLYSAGFGHRPAIKPFAISNVEYRFADRFCRAQYNNPTDRNACMMRATGTPLGATDEADER
jgi:hypothetical protein